ncbi:sphingomyelin phosphodiesterase 5-like isoform X2 [Ascaphus truei]|uniref:sphingomyelin phosphodiesterase 5-like isoform X2 n=1 Tax=Ascaphus truei TaxID=8439 RepID=UPI003F5ACA21
MSLRESPFPCPLLGFLFSLGSVLLFPSYWFVDRLLSCVVPTSVEKSRAPAVRAVLLLLGPPVFLLLLLLSLPLGILGFLLWAPLHRARRSFCYQRGQRSEVPPEKGLEGDHSFLFISANLCLLPEGLARFSNLSHTQYRTTRISQLLSGHLGLAPAQSIGTAQCGTTDPVCIQDLAASPEDILTVLEPARQEDKVPREEGGFPGEVSLVFPPDADFLCLQEVFDGRASRILRLSLASSFPHILYDVGPSGPLGCGFKFFNSGLFLASRHPPLAAKYHYYSNARGEDALAAKGLLCVKVQVGVTEEKQNIVGYINCTHLHAPEADGFIRCDQMSLLLQWLSEFQSQHSEVGDIIAFDVLCGDFNFDNCSTDDCLEQNHEIFSVYKDPCRDCAGRDRKGTVGTLLRQEFLYHEAVKSPENLKRTLQSDRDRRLFIAPPLPHDTGTDGTHWPGRRIDYILYRESGSLPPTVVEQFLFITQLAGLSDHIPVSLRLSISLPLITYL